MEKKKVGDFSWLQSKRGVSTEGLETWNVAGFEDEGKGP